MLGLEDLTRKGITDLLESYDSYIQTANQEDKFQSGWRPVCLHEYLNIEYLDEFGDAEVIS